MSNTELLAKEAFALLCLKYVQRSDDRQKEMGLQYTEAETHHLAELMAKFTRTQLDELRAENERLVGAFLETKAALSLTTLVEDLDGVRECITEIKSRIDHHINKALGGTNAG